MITFLNFLFPFVTFVFFYKHDTESWPAMALCNGKAYLNFFSTNYRLCEYENIYAKYICRIWSIFIYLFMSNIFDAILFYFCAREIKEQTEVAKKMLSKSDYINRRRYIRVI